MPRGNYRSVSIRKDLYDRILYISRGLGRVQSFSDALDVLVPSRCIEGINHGGHIVVNIEIERITLEDIMSIKLGKDVLIPFSSIDKLYGQLFSGNPVARLILELLTLYAVAQSRSVATMRLSFDINAEHLFLVDTGATMTVINIDKLPEDIREHIRWSIKKIPVSTAAQTINLPQGRVKLRVKDIEKTVEARALFMFSGGSQYHILGVTTLARLLGPRVLFDFASGKICMY